MNTKPNIVITGFMGTGKSTVAELVARKLNRTFVDMDAGNRSARGLQLSHRYFRRHGEEGLPRIWNGSLIHELALRHGLVIATGGGALVSMMTIARYDKSAWPASSV